MLAFKNQDIYLNNSAENPDLNMDIKIILNANTKQQSVEGGINKVKPPRIS